MGIAQMAGKPSISFIQFRNKYGGKDLGIHFAVGRVVNAFRQDNSYLSEKFPDDEEQQYVWIFKTIDDAIEKSTGYKKKIATNDRVEKPDSFINLMKDWTKRPEARSKSAPNADNEIDPLMVFYFFSYLHRGLNDQLDPSYAELIESLLEEPGSVARKRVEATALSNGISLDFSGGTAKMDSSSQIIPKVVDLLMGDDAMLNLFYRLDYSDHEGAFTFDPVGFRGNDDEMLLDRMLINLSLVGGILRRGEIGVEDANIIRSYVKVVMGNEQVHKYLQWVHSDDQIPDHSDFADAIYLFDRLIGEQVPALQRYQDVAQAVMAQSDS